MKIFKIIGLFIIAAILLSFVPAMIEGVDLIINQPGASSGGSSSTDGGTSTPGELDEPSEPTDPSEPEDPEDPTEPEDPAEPEAPGMIETYKGVWHVEDHPYHYFQSLVCSSCGTVFESLEDLNFGEDNNMFDFTNFCFLGQVDMQCPSCHYITGLYSCFQFSLYHCFVNGICHDCGIKCSHQFYYASELGLTYQTFLDSLRLICPDHPLLTSDLTFENGDSAIVDGQCMICLCSDFDEVSE